MTREIDSFCFLSRVIISTFVSVSREFALQTQDQDIRPLCAGAKHKPGTLLGRGLSSVTIPGEGGACPGRLTVPRPTGRCNRRIPSTPAPHNHIERRLAKEGVIILWLNGFKADD